MGKWILWLGSMLFWLPARSQSDKIAVGAYGEGHLGFILNQNNYGGNELGYRVYPLPGAGIRLAYPLDVRHRLEAGIGYHGAGQKYHDFIDNQDIDKTISLYYVQLPVFWKECLSGINKWDGNTHQTYWYRSFGLIFNALAKGNIDWSIAGSPVNMLEFVNENGTNPHSSVLNARGNPESYTTLFNAFDISLAAGGGMDYYFNEQWHLSVEMVLQFGLLDINAKPWRLANRNGKYGPSHQTSIGLQLGLWYNLD